jgi:hypothetical protein
MLAIRLYIVFCIGFVPHATATMAVPPSVVEQAIAARAIQVAEPAEWIGFFEWFTIARFYKVNVLLVFGNNIFDVNDVFGKGFTKYRPRSTWYVVGVKLDGTPKPKSAVKPGSCHLDVNHFMACVPITNGCSGLPHLPIDLTKDVTFTGSKRQSAKEACQELNLIAYETERYGECGIDIVAFHRKKVRGPGTWEKIRHEVAGCMLSHSADTMWQ